VKEENAVKCVKGEGIETVHT